MNVEYNEEEKIIVAFDLTDTNNFPACLTKKKRGILTAVGAFEGVNNDEEMKKSITFSKVIELLSGLKLQPHTWCMMD